MVIHWISFPKTSIILVFLGLICRVLGDCAGSNVVTLPYGNVTVLDASVRRGIPLGVGTDPQSLAFLPAGYTFLPFLPSSIPLDAFEPALIANCFFR